jgi:hypothetical protein
MDDPWCHQYTEEGLESYADREVDWNAIEIPREENPDTEDDFYHESFNDSASDDIDYSYSITADYMVNRRLLEITSRDLRLKQCEYVFELNKLGEEYGMCRLAKWENPNSRYKNGLLHTFVLKCLTHVVRFLLEKVLRKISNFIINTIVIDF